MKIIVIGSGISGLTTAAYLSKNGHTVIVYEQFSEIGGVTATLRHKGFGWDLGVMLVSGFQPGERANRILTELGIADKIKVVQSDRGTSFPDFTLWKPKKYQGPYWRREYLKTIFPDESQGLDDYYKFYDTMLALARYNNQLDSMSGIKALLQKAKMWIAFQKIKGKKDWTADKLMDHFFINSKLKAVFTAILADLFIKPSQFPAMGIPLVEEEAVFDKRISMETGKSKPSEGYSYIIGGCSKLVDALAESIHGTGGNIYTNTPVQQIMVEKGRVKGVTLKNGKFESADAVVASGGAYETFFGLIGMEHLPADFTKQLKALQPMESVLEVHLGISFDPTQFQPGALCYYYLSYDVEKDVEESLTRIYGKEVKGFLVYIPSMYSPELAPPGHHSVSIITIAPNQLNEGTWRERKGELADKLVTQVEKYIPGLKKRTVTRVVLTPENFRHRTYQDHHSYGGLPPVIGMDLPPHCTPIKDFWFIGSQSKNLGGVKSVMLGARDTAKEIMADKKWNKEA